MLSPGCVPQNIARVSAALAAVGAWDAAPLAIVIAGAERGTLLFTYTRGGVGGAFDFQIQTSGFSLDALATANLAGIWAAQGLYAAGTLAAGVDTQSEEQREYVTYEATGAAAETFIYGPFDLGGSLERLRIVARESGAVGTPGTLQVELRIS